MFDGLSHYVVYIHHNFLYNIPSIIIEVNHDKKWRIGLNFDVFQFILKVIYEI